MADKPDNLRVSDELDLIVAVLRGYRDSPAKSDALRAAGVIRAEVEALRKDREETLATLHDLMSEVGEAIRNGVLPYEVEQAHWRASTFIDKLAARPGGRG